jgi:hypothetical protein
MGGKQGEVFARAPRSSLRARAVCAARCAKVWFEAYIRLQHLCTRLDLLTGGPEPEPDFGRERAADDNERRMYARNYNPGYNC